MAKTKNKTTSKQASSKKNKPRLISILILIGIILVTIVIALIMNHKNQIGKAYVSTSNAKPIEKPVPGENTDVTKNYKNCCCNVPRKPQETPICYYSANHNNAGCSQFNTDATKKGCSNPPSWSDSICKYGKCQ